MEQQPEWLQDYSQTRARLERYYSAGTARLQHQTYEHNQNGDLSPAEGTASPHRNASPPRGPSALQKTCSTFSSEFIFVGVLTKIKGINMLSGIKNDKTFQICFKQAGGVARRS